MNPISQGTVRPYILASLVAHGGEAHATVVTEEALRDVGGDPQNASHRQTVANARHDLKGRGCVVDGAKRGCWAITDAGRAAHGGAPLPPYVKAAKPAGATLVEVFAETPETELSKADTTPEAPVEVAPATEAPVEVAPAPVEVAPVVETPVVEASSPAPASKRRLKVAAPVPAVPVPEWYSDEGLRAMVIESAECFGAWAARSAECGQCTLAGHCRNAKAASLVLLATKIRLDEPVAPGPSPVAESVAKLDETLGAANAPDAARTAPKPEEEGFTLQASFDTVCAMTGAPIKQGQTVRYVKGKGLVLVP
jgi:hypothetical protein